MDINTVEYTFPNTPPSVNACYRSAGRRVYKSKRLREYEQEMKEFFGTLDDVPMLEGKLKLEVHLFFKSKRKRDLDNCMKALLDRETV